MGIQLPSSKGGGAHPIFGRICCGQMAAWITMLLGMEVGPGPGDFVLDGDPAPSPKRGRNPQIFSPCLLWPNGWMDQDSTCHKGRPQPRRLYVRWGPSHLPQKGAEPPSPIFGLFLLWPNGWMYQDGTWYGGRPQPRRLCVRWGPSPSPKRRRSPQFSGHVYCGQTTAWIKMHLVRR